MTRQYLVGEMSLLLGELVSWAPGHPSSDEMACLRSTVEKGTATALDTAARRALEVARALCWESLSAGDLAAFNRQIAMCTEIRELAIGVGALADD